MPAHAAKRRVPTARSASPCGRLLGRGDGQEVCLHGPAENRPAVDLDEASSFINRRRGIEPPWLRSRFGVILQICRSGMGNCSRCCQLVACIRPDERAIVAIRRRSRDSVFPMKAPGLSVSIDGAIVVLVGKVVPADRRSIGSCSAGCGGIRRLRLRCVQTIGMARLCACGDVLSNR